MENQINEEKLSGTSIFFSILFLIGIFAGGWYSHSYFIKPDIDLEKASELIETLQILLLL